MTPNLPMIPRNAEHRLKQLSVVPLPRYYRHPQKALPRRISAVPLIHIVVETESDVMSCVDPAPRHDLSAHAGP
jgi:hypothetical protein